MYHIRRLAIQPSEMDGTSGKYSVKQNDSHNCGPLSCLKVYELFIDKDIFMDTDVNSYRLDVMDK
jgi:hypothetical protein